MFLHIINPRHKSLAFLHTQLVVMKIGEIQDFYVTIISGDSLVVNFQDFVCILLVLDSIPLKIKLLMLSQFEWSISKHQLDSIHGVETNLFCTTKYVMSKPTIYQPIGYIKKVYKSNYGSYCVLKFLILIQIIKYYTDVDLVINLNFGNLHDVQNIKQEESGVIISSDAMVEW